jgi:hypothetical protein
MLNFYYITVTNSSLVQILPRFNRKNCPPALFTRILQRVNDVMMIAPPNIAVPGAPRLRPVLRAARQTISSVILAGSVGLLPMLLPVAAQNNTVSQPVGDPVNAVARGLKMRAPPVITPDWVVKTRKPGQEAAFVPTGAAARTEPAAPMSLNKLKEVEKSLDAARERHDRLGARTAGPAARRSVAIAPLPKKKLAKRACVLTCVTPIGGRKK